MKNDRPKSPLKFYTIEQIAECVGASTRTVRRWAEAGDPRIPQPQIRPQAATGTGRGSINRR